MKFRTILIAAAALAAPIAAIAPAHADGGIFVGVNQGSIAVGGFDTVSYFQGDGVPVKGDARFTVQYMDAEWRFSSQANADAFKENPAAYAPQFGGHCAWAMSRGSLAPGDPQVYKLVDGKLYLNVNKQVQSMWLKDIPGFIAKANVAWKNIPTGQRFGD
ncbi:YHS domain-containing (seleno)protein [Erythrobacter crassostreae]|uniref:YHS domain-containing protein n=1 Tax=Erythrobacter crassostreae TaxID=2828328 RepID=A0A9X1JNM9_9SPHN|nr:YHS domain-containing (seleno)protein [Erythrobacter crassostrea]MBV7259868.1 YHS domain-containing protein [Erythrobacter crassostrea]